MPSRLVQNYILIILMLAFMLLWKRYTSRKQKKDEKLAVAQLPSAALVFNIQHNVCPDCGKGGQGEPYQFLMGPCGGAAMNIKCKDCGMRFNVAPLDDDGRLWEIFFASRLGKD